MKLPADRNIHPTGTHISLTIYRVRSSRTCMYVYMTARNDLSVRIHYILKYIYNTLLAHLASHAALEGYPIQINCATGQRAHFFHVSSLRYCLFLFLFLLCTPGHGSSSNTADRSYSLYVIYHVVAGRLGRRSCRRLVRAMTLSSYRRGPVGEEGRREKKGLYPHHRCKYICWCAPPKASA